MTTLIRPLTAVLLLTGLASTGQAADLPSRTSTPAAPYQSSQFEWSGFYLGASGDYVASFKGTGDIKATTGNILNPNTAGYGGSLYGGYNRQFNSLVIGVEADGSLRSLSDSKTAATGASSGNFKANFPLAQALRTRIGYTFNNVLLYAAGGLSINQTKINANATINGTAVKGSETKALSGYTIGGGLEYGVSRNLVARTEYRFNHYEKASFFGVKFGADSQEIRAGLGYKF